MLSSVRRWKLKNLCWLLLFAATALFAGLYFGLNVSWYMGSSSENVVDAALPTLKRARHEIPVVIVDEHHEVIPYWYKAVEEGIIKESGNTLIHIDAHSDMATPNDYESINSFEHTVPSYPSMFLPLMERNDVFILSAILKGLISTVVWVKPNWLESGPYIMIANSYVGKVQRNNSDQATVCNCFKPLQSNFHMNTPKCFLVDRIYGEDIELFDHKACKKVRSYKQIWLSEDNLKDVLQFQRVKSTIIDIDEDYFGVESGVTKFMEMGVSEQLQDELTDILASIYCPKHVEAEQTIDDNLRKYFAAAVNIVNGHRSIEDLSSILDKLSEKTMQFFCADYLTHSHILKRLTTFTISLNKEEAAALSIIRYCLVSSPRLKDHPIRFGACHGTIFPGDPINEIHVTNESDIEERGKRLTDIMEFISNHLIANFFTVARSVRDGYTPRNQQRYIEKTVKQALERVLKRREKSPRIFYDEYLLFGPEGWPQIS